MRRACVQPEPLDGGFFLWDPGLDGFGEAVLVHVGDCPARDPDDGLRAGLRKSGADSLVPMLRKSPEACSSPSQAAQGKGCPVSLVSGSIVPIRTNCGLELRHGVGGVATRVLGGHEVSRWCPGRRFPSSWNS